MTHPAEAPRTVVNGALGARRFVNDHGARPDQEHPGIDEGPGDRRTRTGENAGIRLARHPHPFSRRILIESLEVGEADRLELVEAD